MHAAVYKLMVIAIISLSAPALLSVCGEEDYEMQSQTGEATPSALQEESLSPVDHAESATMLLTGTAVDPETDDTQREVCPVCHSLQYPEQAAEAVPSNSDAINTDWKGKLYLSGTHTLSLGLGSATTLFFEWISGFFVQEHIYVHILRDAVAFSLSSFSNISAASMQCLSPDYNSSTNIFNCPMATFANMGFGASFAERVTAHNVTFYDTANPL